MMNKTMMNNKLSAEELAMTAGGREIRSSEMKTVLERKANLNLEMSSLRSSGQHNEVWDLNKRYSEALNKWRNDIANASEDSGDINFSKYLPY